MPVKSKMITVTSRGYVRTSRGRVFAPIPSPYREETSVIFQMIAKDDAKVVEHLPNGQKIELNVQNFDRDNSIAPKPVKVEEPKEEVAIPATPVEDDGMVAMVESTDTSVDASVDTVDVEDGDELDDDAVDGQSSDEVTGSVNQPGNPNRQRHKKNRH